MYLKKINSQCNHICPPPPAKNTMGTLDYNGSFLFHLVPFSSVYIALISTHVSLVFHSCSTCVSLVFHLCFTSVPVMFYWVLLASISLPTGSTQINHVILVLYSVPLQFHSILISLLFHCCFTQFHLCFIWFHFTLVSLLFHSSFTLVSL